MKFVTSDYVVHTTHAKLGYRAQMGACPHSGGKCSPSVYFFLSIFLYFYVYLLTCTGRTVDRMNIVNGA